MKAPATTRPLRLKALLTRHRIRHDDLLVYVHQENGVRLSRPAFSLWINGRKPVMNTAAEHLHAQIRAALWAYFKVSDAELATAFDPEPEPLTDAPPPSADETPTDPEIKPVETDMLSQATKKHFGLIADPFKDDVQDPKDVFQTEDTRYVSQSMLQTARTAGLLCVVAESGAGKSTLRKMFYNEVLKDNALRIIAPKAIDKKKITTSSMLGAIIRDLAPGTRVPHDEENRSNKVEELFRQGLATGAKHVLVIEEAHNLEPQMFVNLKRFWEIEVSKLSMARPLSILLIAMPEIRPMLDEAQHPELREFIRRCEVVELEPINRYVRPYLAFKFKRIQADVSRVLAEDAYDAIVKRLTVHGKFGPRSMVYPQIVNNLVTRAMNEAAKAGMKQVTADVVEGI